jgi:hypothetical protein
MNTDKTRKNFHKNSRPSDAINKRLIELNPQIFHDMLRNYEFEQRGNRIFIMSKQVKEFDKVISVRKGLLFAEIRGQELVFSNSAKDIIKILIENTTNLV